MAQMMSTYGLIAPAVCGLLVKTYGGGESIRDAHMAIRSASCGDQIRIYAVKGNTIVFK